MTALEKLIYVSDFVEPNRKAFPGLAEAQALAESDLNAAARLCARLTSEHVISTGGVPDARTLQTMEE